MPTLITSFFRCYYLFLHSKSYSFTVGLTQFYQDCKQVKGHTDMSLLWASRICSITHSSCIQVKCVLLLEDRSLLGNIAVLFFVGFAIFRFGLVGLIVQKFLIVHEIFLNASVSSIVFNAFRFIFSLFPLDFLNTRNLSFAIHTAHFKQVKSSQIIVIYNLDYYNRQHYKFEQQTTTMGVTQSNFAQSLQFVQILNDRHFGQIQIFKSFQTKFIMKNNKSYITGDKRYQEFKKIIDFVQTKSNPNLIPILYIQQQHESNVCIEYEKVFIYTEYFNFTLEGLILHKKQIQIAQLWYCMRSLLELINLLIQNNLKIQLSLDNIFLTLKGVPSVYLYHLMEEDFIKNGDNIIKQSDIVDSRTMFYDLGKVILQLLCMEKIPDGEQEVQTFFIEELICKAQVKSIVLTNFIKQLLHTKYSNSIFQNLQNLIKQKKIKISNQIRFNKFKYVIPDQKNQKRTLQIKIDSQVNLAKPTQLNSMINNSFKTPLYKIQSNRTFSSENIKQKAKTQYQEKNSRPKNGYALQSSQKAKQFFANPKIEIFDEAVSQKCINDSQTQKATEPIAIRPRRKSQSISNKSKQIIRTQQEKAEQKEVINSKIDKKESLQNKQLIPSSNNAKLLDRMKILNILKQKQDTFNISSSRNLDSSDFLSDIQKKKNENQKKMMQLNLRKQMMEKGFKKQKRQGFQSQDKQNKTTQNNISSLQLTRGSSNSLRQSHKVNQKPINFLTSFKESGKRVPSNLDNNIVPKLK